MNKACDKISLALLNFSYIRNEWLFSILDTYLTNYPKSETNGSQRVGRDYKRPQGNSILPYALFCGSFELLSDVFIKEYMHDASQSVVMHRKICQNKDLKTAYEGQEEETVGMGIEIEWEGRVNNETSVVKQKKSIEIQ